MGLRDVPSSGRVRMQVERNRRQDEIGNKLLAPVSRRNNDIVDFDFSQDRREGHLRFSPFRVPTGTRILSLTLANLGGAGERIFFR